MIDSSRSCRLTVVDSRAFLWLLAALVVTAQGCTFSREDSRERGGLLPVKLRCGHLVDPLGVDDPNPRLSWALRALDPGDRGQVQTAYQVIVGTDAETLSPGTADVWNSGRVVSGEQLQIAIPVGSLSSGQRCYWKVRVWDREGRPSPWSDAAFFEMGLLHPHDWAGVWIHDGKAPPEIGRAS